MTVIVNSGTTDTSASNVNTENILEVAFSDSPFRIPALEFFTREEDGQREPGDNNGEWYCVSFGVFLSISSTTIDTTFNNFEI